MLLKHERYYGLGMDASRRCKISGVTRGAHTLFVPTKQQKIEKPELLRLAVIRWVSVKPGLPWPRASAESAVGV